MADQERPEECGVHTEGGEDAAFDAFFQQMRQ